MSLSQICTATLEDGEKREQYVPSNLYYVADWAARLPSNTSSTNDKSFYPQMMDKNGHHGGTSQNSNEQGGLHRARGSLDASGRRFIDDNSSRSTGHGGTDQFNRRTTSILPRSPASSDHSLAQSLPMPPGQAPRSTPRQSSYGYYTDESPQYGAPSLQSTPLNYQSDYSTPDQMQRQGPYGAYPQNMVYNLQHQTPNDPYEQAYPPRQPTAAAIEVLSSQFGVPQFYQGETSPHTSSAMPQHQAQAQAQAQYSP